LILENQIEVVLYAADGCNGCYRVKEFLRRHQVPYLEKNVSKNSEYWHELKDLGSQVVPTIIINGHVLIGLRPNRLLRLIEEHR
jgi:glutaredoxin